MVVGNSLHLRAFTRQADFKNNFVNLRRLKGVNSHRDNSTNSQLLHLKVKIEQPVKFSHNTMFKNKQAPNSFLGNKLFYKNKSQARSLQSLHKPLQNAGSRVLNKDLKHDLTSKKVAKELQNHFEHSETVVTKQFKVSAQSKRF